MSNHFTGLSLGPPMGDQRRDLCDLYAFASPANPEHTVLILNANPNADALHPDAIYRLAIDNDGDLRDDIAFSFLFSEPVDGRQSVDVYLATDDDANALSHKLANRIDPVAVGQVEASAGVGGLGRGNVIGNTATNIDRVTGALFNAIAAGITGVKVGEGLGAAVDSGG